VCRSILLFKTPTSLVPRVLLIDLVSRERSSETAAPKPGLKLMRRDRPGDGARNGGRGGGRGGTQEGKGPGSKSVSEREREYAEARARIFGTSTPTNTGAGANGSGGAKGGEEEKEAKPAGGGGGSGAANGQGAQQEEERRRVRGEADSRGGEGKRLFRGGLKGAGSGQAQGTSTCLTWLRLGTGRGIAGRTAAREPGPLQAGVTTQQTMERATKGQSLLWSLSTDTLYHFHGFPAAPVGP
jgi:hypothetical protein